VEAVKKKNWSDLDRDCSARSRVWGSGVPN